MLSIAVPLCTTLGANLELRTSVAWDGKERRKGGKAADLRERIDELRRRWDARTAPAEKALKSPKRRTSRTK